MPMMAFIGVRISWLMLARNMDFIRVASSAFGLGLLQRDLLFLPLRDVADRDGDLRPLACPCGSGLSPISTGNSEPSLRTPRSSRPAPIARGAAAP